MVIAGVPTLYQCPRRSGPSPTAGGAVTTAALRRSVRRLRGSMTRGRPSRLPVPGSPVVTTAPARRARRKSVRRPSAGHNQLEATARAPTPVGRLSDGQAAQGTINWRQEATSNEDAPPVAPQTLLGEVPVASIGFGPGLRALALVPESTVPPREELYEIEWDPPARSPGTGCAPFLPVPRSLIPSALSHAVFRRWAPLLSDTVPTVRWRRKVPSGESAWPPVLRPTEVLTSRRGLASAELSALLVVQRAVAARIPDALGLVFPWLLLIRPYRTRPGEGAWRLLAAVAGKHSSAPLPVERVALTG